MARTATLLFALVSCTWEDNVLRIAPPAQLARPQHFSGQRVDVDFHDTDLRKAMAELAALGVNGLDWARDGKTLKVFPGRPR